MLGKFALAPGPGKEAPLIDMLLQFNNISALQFRLDKDHGTLLLLNKLGFNIYLDVKPTANRLTYVTKNSHCKPISLTWC